MVTYSNWYWVRPEEPGSSTPTSSRIDRYHLRIDHPLSSLDSWSVECRTCCWMDLCAGYSLPHYCQERSDWCLESPSSIGFDRHSSLLGSSSIQSCCHIAMSLADLSCEVTSSLTEKSCLCSLTIWRCWSALASFQRRTTACFHSSLNESFF